MGKFVTKFRMWSRDPGFKNSSIVDLTINKNVPIEEIIDWCEEYLIGDFIIYYKYTFMNCKWQGIFTDKEDAMVFKLRWL